jgi:hypothetical protein
MRNSAVYQFALLCLAAVVIAGATHAIAAQGQDEELQMGQEVFNELKAKGEIIDSSPYTTSCARSRTPSSGWRSPNTTTPSSSTWSTKLSRMPSPRRGLPGSERQPKVAPAWGSGARALASSILGLLEGLIFLAEFCQQTSKLRAVLETSEFRFPVGFLDGIAILKCFTQVLQGFFRAIG